MVLVEFGPLVPDVLTKIPPFCQHSKMSTIIPYSAKMITVFSIAQSVKDFLDAFGSEQQQSNMTGRGSKLLKNCKYLLKCMLYSFLPRHLRK